MLNDVKTFEEKIVKRMMRYVDDEIITSRIPQPMLIVGAHGSGKSSIINIFSKELEDRKDILTLKIFDGKLFFSSNDIITSIEGDAYDESQFYNLEKSPNRRIVIIDELDYYFKRSSFEDQYILRNYLSKETAPLLIGTLNTIDESISNYKAPFFEGIRLIYIPPFNESMYSLNNFTEEKASRLKIMMRYLSPTIGSYKLANDILSISNDEKTDLIELLDRHSPIFRRRFDELPLYSQSIIMALAYSHTPLSLSDLRERTGLASGTLSTYIRQIVESGFIHKVNPDKRGSPYIFSDALFKLWLSRNKT